MKQLFDQDVSNELKGRIARIPAASEPRWGRMNVAQALAHCAIGLEDAMGDRRPPRMAVGFLLGPLIKWLALRDEAPMRPNSPTIPGMVVADERDVEAERARLLAVLDRFVRTGPTGCTSHPHAFFGRLTPQEWATLQYKHLDHHLRQFGG